jgi:3-oxoacyl-[acyl-carrier-protein] synthase II
VHRVVVTGLGLATSLGPDVETCWNRLIAGENGIRRISFWDPSQYQTKVAGEVREMPREVGLTSYPGKFCRRPVRLFAPVAKEAFRDAGLDPGNLEQSGLGKRDIGLSLGASVNYLDMSLMRAYFRLAEPGKFTLSLRRLLEQGEDLPRYTFFRRQGDTLASVASRLLGIGGPSLINDTACAASAYAVGDAYHLIRRGRVRAMLAGGAAALVSPLSILAFAVIGALSRSEDPDSASRPFDRRRDGFVMGEGAGAVVLESLENAQQRGAHIYGEITGFGASLNAHNLTDPSPGGIAEAEAMRLALAEAGTAPEEVDYIAAHGTSTQKNDSTETQAIKSVFGGHAAKLAVSSNKGQIGHTISAAGISNLVFTLKSMENEVIPPTMHFEDPDPECDLDYVPNRSRRGRVRNALVNAFAFGGQNAVLAVRAWPAQ